MTYYIIQTTHITDKGTTVTRYYSESKYESLLKLIRLCYENPSKKLEVLAEGSSQI